MSETRGTKQGSLNLDVALREWPDVEKTQEEWDDRARMVMDRLHAGDRGSTAASSAARYPGAVTRNTRDNLVLLAGKFGLSRRDIPMALSLFAPVRVRDDGSFAWQADLLSAGNYVDLRAEMDLLVGLSNTPHPLDPAPLYDPPPVTVTRYRARTLAGDLCRTATAEAVRGFANNARAEA